MEKGPVPSASLSAVTMRSKDGVAHCVTFSISFVTTAVGKTEGYCHQAETEAQREHKDMLKVRQPSGGWVKKTASALSGEGWTDSPRYR